MNRTTLYEPVRDTHLHNYRPVVWTPSQVAEYVTTGGHQTSDDGNTWVAARPMSGFQTLRGRIKLAWAVFKGQADVLQWEQGQ